jgi:hypothetical protein
MDQAIYFFVTSDIPPKLEHKAGIISTKLRYRNQ